MNSSWLSMPSTVETCELGLSVKFPVSSSLSSLSFAGTGWGECLGSFGEADLGKWFIHYYNNYSYAKSKMNGTENFTLVNQRCNKKHNEPITIQQNK